MRRTHKTKIVATLGPASTGHKTIRMLFDAGVDVFRLNLSHGSHEDHAGNIAAIREVESAVERPIAIMLDLQGPKLRIGDFTGGEAKLETGKAFRLDLDTAEGDAHRVCLPHTEIFEVIEPGREILVNDGRVRLQVLSCGQDYAETEIVVGGTLSNHKGVNLPGVILPLSSMTEKDRKDLEFGLSHGVDWCALSFVQKPDDLDEALRIIDGRIPILVKLEKPTAINQLEEIIDASDAIMVARGDLGVEMPAEDVPVLQRRITRACRNAGKPVVIATQMLESMISALHPTRAEASDVATAVYEGADAVMLSAETAAGEYPVESVQMMNRIIERAESDPMWQGIMNAEAREREPTASDAISAAARQVSNTLSATAIITYTTSGSTTLRAARERPDVPIIGLTPEQATARRMALVWGVHSIHTEDAAEESLLAAKARRWAARDGFAKPGDHIVITAGIPFGTPGATNLFRITEVTEKDF